MTHDWLDKSAYPFPSNYFEINGHQLHYIDEGQGEIILFIHGTPSWSFDYRHIIKVLRSSYRCIAIDHIGFGLSDKPEHYDYSTINHSLTLERFILEKGLKHFTLVVHDFGGPIGLNVAMKYPEKIDRIIVLNSWLWSSAADSDFIKFSKILKSPILPFLYRYLNFSPRFILPGSFGDHQLSKWTLQQYTRPFVNKTQRNGALAFARSLFNDQDWFETLWERKIAIAHKPVLLIWGMKDPVIKPKYLERFVLGFPGAQVIKLDTCGHFPQEEQPEKVAAGIFNFMNSR